MSYKVDAKQIGWRIMRMSKKVDEQQNRCGRNWIRHKRRGWWGSNTTTFLSPTFWKTLMTTRYRTRSEIFTHFSQLIRMIKVCSQLQKFTLIEKKYHILCFDRIMWRDVCSFRITGLVNNENTKFEWITSENEQKWRIHHQLFKGKLWNTSYFWGNWWFRNNWLFPKNHFVRNYLVIPEQKSEILHKQCCNLWPRIICRYGRYSRFAVFSIPNANFGQISCQFSWTLLKCFHSSGRVKSGRVLIVAAEDSQISRLLTNNC